GFLKTTRAHVPSADFQIAQSAQEPPALLARNRSAALRMIEATGFAFALKGRRRCAERVTQDRRKHDDAQGLAAARAAHVSLLLVPQFAGNRQGARRAGDRVGG